MPVLVLAEVEGQTQEKYDAMLHAIGSLLLDTPGFIAHGAGPSGNGWRTFEVWESQAAATQFFATHIHPNLPPGVTPKRTLIELHSLIVS